MTSTNHQPNAKTNSIQSHNFILGYKCVDELNRFVAQRQKELFTAISRDFVTPVERLTVNTML